MRTRYQHFIGIQDRCALQVLKLLVKTLRLALLLAFEHARACRVRFFQVSSVYEVCKAALGVDPARLQTQAVTVRAGSFVGMAEQRWKGRDWLPCD